MMDLWIKSQNKGVFARVSGVYIEETKYFKENKSYFKPIELEKVRWKIVGMVDMKVNCTFGEYETKTRALEIIQEIENIIFASKDNNLKLYRMPEE